ncbi:Uncharacterised protein [Vibrio cholerae]|nr:Uncharacterised protein [Vibrio cholerae]
MLFSRKSVRSTNSFKPRHADSIAWNCELCRISSICALIFLSSSTNIWSTRDLLTGSAECCEPIRFSINAATPFFAMS